jgi:hypothetical protein
MKLVPADELLAADVALVPLEVVRDVNWNIFFTIS